MMRRRGGRRPVQYEDEEDERVVYYDLDDGSHNRNLLLYPDASSAPPQSRAAAVGEVDQIFTRQQQQPLFNLDDSESEEEENPFATLLKQQQVQNAVKSAAEVEEAATSGDMRRHHNSFVCVATATGVSSKEQAPRRPVGRGGDHRSILKDSQQFSTTTPRVSASNKKKLGFEAAGSRPERWSTRKPSAIDTKNRRKSLGAIQKRRSQLEASAAKRRKSMPSSFSRSQATQNSSVTEDSMGSGPAAPKKRLLFDVLQRATTLSQQQSAINEGSSIVQAPTDGNPTEGDAILDTEHQMRAEPFTPQIFSPAKPASTITNTKWKSKGDAIVSKIRGNVGEAIRKAIRRRNRDLTLLRSHGQHLLPQQSNHSLPRGMSGAVESIQDRAYILICLKRRCAVTPHSVLYECQIHKVAEKTTASVLKDKHTMVVEAIFQLQAAEYLKLSSGQLLKIYEPLRFVEEKGAAGSASKLKWFLLSTQLTEVVQDSHHCTDQL